MTELPINVPTSNLKEFLPSHDYGIEKFKYRINELLNSNSSIDSSGKIINLCLFKVVERNNTLPIILYLLNKDKHNHNLYFPHYDGNNDQDIYKKANDYVKLILKNVNYIPLLKGNLEFKNQIYIFFELNFKYNIEKLDQKKDWCWTSIFEIVNSKFVLNFPIHTSVTQLFLNNSLLLFLYNENNNKLPSPEIVYLQTNSSILSFLLTLGIPRSSSNNSLGPYYFFKTYNQVKNDIIKNKYKNGVIIRLAVFTKKINYLLKEPTKNWIHGYNSVFFYNNENKQIKFGIKEYNQQNILSYHYENNEK
jgi:hypothetical protein